MQAKFGAWALGLEPTPVPALPIHQHQQKLDLTGVKKYNGSYNLILAESLQKRINEMTSENDRLPVKILDNRRS